MRMGCKVLLDASAELVSDRLDTDSPTVSRKLSTIQLRWLSGDAAECNCCGFSSERRSTVTSNSLTFSS